MNNNSNIVVRIPPSPTGNLHLGTARTALFNYLFAKQNGGKIIFRLEDTDKERSKKEFEVNIVDGLKWLGIDWDNETIYRQSERSAEYKVHLEKIKRLGFSKSSIACLSCKISFISFSIASSFSVLSFEK